MKLMISIKMNVIIATIFFTCFTACKNKTSLTSPNVDTTTLHFTVEKAPEWTVLFNRKQGWFGADGIFSIPLNGIDTGSDENDTTLLIFSDTMIGEIINGKLKPGYKMIHNSIAYFKGSVPKEENIHFIWDTTADGKPESIFKPATPAAQKEDYYWLGDGFVNKELHNNIYIFAYRIRDIKDTVFGFKEVGNCLLIIPKGSRAPFKNIRQLDTPFFLEGNGNNASDYGSLGAGIFVNTKSAGAPNPDGYVYVYGVKGKDKGVIVARVLPKDFENFSKWNYWDGNKWNSNIHSITSITNRASNELSLTPLPDGRYALVFQVDGISRFVGMRIGLSPVGPFGPIITLWNCKDDLLTKNFITYNAKVHANLSTSNELLISYNVNSFDFFNEILLYPNLYRPRFLRVKLQ